VFYFDAYTVRV